MSINEKELSERELEILGLIANGASNKEIANRLSISTNTVKVHLRNIFSKLDARSRTEAAMFAVNAGLVPGVGKIDLASVSGREDITAGYYLSSSPLEAEQVGSQRLPGIKRINRLLVLLAAAILVALLGILVISISDRNERSAVLIAEENAKRWKTLASMPTARFGLAAAAFEGSIYSIGGETEHGQTGLVERYDPVLDRWYKLSHKPIPVSEIGAVVVEGKIFIPGGKLATGKATDVLEIYDPRMDQWSEGAPIPKPVSGYGLAVFEGSIFLFGGLDGHDYSDKVYKYNVQLDTWQVMPSLPSPRAFAGVGVASRKIFVIGGFDGEKAFSENLVYSPDLNSNVNGPWDLAAELPTHRYGMGVSAIAEIVEVVGGIQIEKGPILSLSYFPIFNQWQEFGALEITPQFPGIVSLGNFIYIIGGHIDSRPLDQNLAYQAIYTVSFPIVQ